MSIPKEKVSSRPLSSLKNPQFNIPVRLDIFVSIDIDTVDIYYPRMFSVQELINNGNIHTRFQPIFSFRNRSIAGFEALSYAETESGIISPEHLFKQAKSEEMLLDLDRACRTAALKNFAAERPDGTAVLFMNFESSLIDMNVTGSGHIFNQCGSAGISPENIVIEIVESRVQDEKNLKRFVDIHRDYGFSIAIDDVGEGYSNLNRIALLKPDIIKADRALCQGINKDYMKQKIVSSLSALSRNIGSLFLAEGIESEDDSVSVFRLGADMIQGYYLAKPGPIDREALSGSLSVLETISVKARNLSIAKEAYRTRYISGCFAALEKAAETLSVRSTESFNACLTEFTHILGHCECMYILNQNGIQETDTVIAHFFPEKVRSAVIFHPACRGTDHSFKEYFYFASLHQHQYATDFYVSLASGKPCITLTLPFYSKTSEKVYYLCADFTVQD